MADYRFLTDQERADIVTELAAAQPTAEDVEHEAERAHFRRVTAAKIRGDEDGAAEPYIAPSTDIQNAAGAITEVDVIASEIGVVLDPKVIASP